MSVNWYGPQIRRQIESEMRRRVQACCIVVQTHAKDLVNVEGTGKRTSRSRRIRTWHGAAGTVAGVQVRTLAGGHKQTWFGKYHRKSKGSLIYGANPSKPGDPPHKQTGHLLRSITREMASQFVGRVGTNLKYGRWLEQGTSKMAARPWLVRSLNEMASRINQILGSPFTLH